MLRADIGIDLLEGMASLADKSLINRLDSADAASAEPRFAMLEVLRDYALERLAEAGEASLYRRAHAAYCLVVREEGGATPEAASQSRWLNQCDYELSNIRAACSYLVQSGQTEWALRMANSLSQFWQARGMVEEGEARARAALDLPDSTRYPAMRAQGLVMLSAMVHIRGSYPEALAVLDQALVAFNGIGDWRGAATAWNAAGIINRDAGDYAIAEHAFAESIRLWRETGDGLAVAQSVSNLASVALRAGRYGDARRLYAECRALFSSARDEAGITWSLQHEGDAARDAGELSEARDLYAEAYRRFERMKDDWGISSSQTALGDLELHAGHVDAALGLFNSALAATRRIGSPRGTARLLDAYARAAAAAGHSERALRLAGAASALRHNVGAHLPDNERASLDRALTGARAGAGAAAAWMEGSAMSIDAATRYATGAT